MADITSEDMRTLIETLQENTRAMGGRGSRGEQRSTRTRDDADAKKLTVTKLATKSLNDQAVALALQSKTIRDVDRSMGKLDDSVGILSKSMVGVAVAMGSIAAGLIKEIPKTIDTYRQLNDVGQDFGGSMLQMNKMATEGRLNLEDFAKVVKKNSLVMSTVGVKSFMSMSVGVRDSLDRFGMLGLTTDELNDYLGSYLETQRQYGHAERLNQQQSIDSTRDMVENITKFSQMTGKSRTEIMKSTELALRDASLAAYQSQLSGKASEDLTKNLGKAAAYLAALPGETGGHLAQMLAQTVARGSSWLTEGVDRLGSVGMGSINDMITSMADKVKKGTLDDAELDKFRARALKIGKESMASLHSMTMSTDATTRENAKFAIQMINDMSSLSKKKVKEIEAQNQITNTLLRLQETWSKVTKFVRDTFFTALGGALDGFEKSLETKEFQVFKDQMIQYGTQFTAWMKNISTSDFWPKLGGAISIVIDTLTFMSKVIGGAVDVFTTLQNKFTTLGVVLGGVLTYLAVKKGASLIKDKLNEKFDLKADPFKKYSMGNALRVYVQNQPGGGGGGGFSMEGDERRRRRTDQVRRGRRAQALGRTAGTAWQNTKSVARMPVGVAAQRAGYGAGYGVGRTGRALGTAGRAVGRTAGAIGRGAVTGAKAVGRGLGRAAVGTANFVKAAAPTIKGMAGGIGGLVLAGASMALDNAEDFTGKQLAKLGLAAASGAATGAMFGPLGALVGGVVGAGIELMSNWDAIAADFTKSISGTVDYISKSFTWVTDGISVFGNKISDSWNWMKNGVKDGYDSLFKYGSDISQSVGDTVSQGLTGAADWLKSNVEGFATRVSDTWKALSSYDWSGMFGNLGSGAMKMMSLANPIASMAIGTVSKALNSVNITAPTDPKPTTLASVEMTAMENRMKNMQDRMDAKDRENAELRTTFQKLIDLMDSSNNTQKAGLTELVEQQRRNNIGIDSLNRKF